MYFYHFANTICKEVKPLAKEFDNKSKHNGSNKGSSSADIANQPGHSAEYHKSAGDEQKKKK
jgi:type IV secretory pathway VirB6-like protein